MSERACHLFTLLGPAGAGKSRLVAEFLVSSRQIADVLHARCLHYGEDITYWPLVEILLAIGVEPDDVIGSSPAETQLAFRKLLEARAAGRPQIVVIDDIQWAEPVFLDLIEHIADWSRDAPILLLCVARPDLLEERPGWGGGKLNATTILLEPLSARGLRGAASTPWRSTSTFRRTARPGSSPPPGGNPLFLEEMVAMVGESGGDGEVVVPPTIQALLQARLDRLGTEERDVIGRGAVEGQVFHRGAVQRAGAGARARRRPRPPSVARPQGGDPAGSGDVRRRRGVPLPAPPDPRRRLRLAARRRRAPSCTSGSPTGSSGTRRSSSRTRSSATTSSAPTATEPSSTAPITASTISPGGPRPGSTPRPAAPRLAATTEPCAGWSCAPSRSCPRETRNASS